MENRNENVLRMFNAVLQYLKQNLTAWLGNKALEEVVQEVTGQVGEIESLWQVVKSDQSGLTKGKIVFKLELIGEILALVSVMSAMAVRTKNVHLQGKTQLTESDLTRLTEAELVIVAKNVLELAVENLGQLATYQVTQDDITNKETILNNYKNSLAVPRATGAERSKANQRIKTLVKQTSQMLKQQLDKLMIPYKKSNPDFYGGYKIVRKTLDYGIRHENPEDPVNPKGPAPEGPAPEA